MQRSKFPLVYNVDPASPSLQSQQPHLSQSSCQYMSRALRRYLQATTMMWCRLHNVESGESPPDGHQNEIYLSWIFFPHPAHSWGPDVFWGSALTDIVMMLKRRRKKLTLPSSFHPVMSQRIENQATRTFTVRTVECVNRVHKFCLFG